MAVAERADLIARLTLDSRQFGQGVSGALGKLKGMEGSLGRIGKLGATGLKNAGANLAKIGAVAGGFIALNVRQGIDSLAQLEDATTAVDGALKTVGLTGKVTSGQIAAWANEIESSVQAAFDDKDITAATATLLRYGKVTQANIKPAMVVMTDLAAKTGDVSSASSLLAKALADPEKAAGKLARVGVILTKQQQDQIKKMTKAGDVAGAQTVLLDALAKSTKGAAAASKGPFNDALNTMKDSIEDVQRILGTAFLPLIVKVADKIKKLASDPKFLQQVKDFGKTLAGGFDKLLTIAGNIDWALIGNSLKTAGQGAKAVFDAFTMLPPWVQQAVLTGWGLNKLSGGALGSIVGELGKGLIKGVLGMTAGVVNAKAGVVNVSGGVVNGGGGQGVPGGSGAAGLGIPSLATFGSATAAIAISLIPLAAAELALSLRTHEQRVTDSLNARTETNIARGGSGAVPTGDIAAGGSGGRTAQRDVMAGWLAQNSPVKVTSGSPDERQEAHDTRAAIVSARLAQIGAIKDGTASNQRAISSARLAQVSAIKSGDNAVVAAIRANRPIIKLSVTSNTFIRMAREAGVYTASHIGAYNHAGSLID